MELPDEAISYHYQSLLVPTGEAWTAAAEMRTKHFLPTARLKDLMPRLLQAKSQVAADREVRNPPPELQPLEPGFIDLPQAHLDAFRRKGEASDLGRILDHSTRLRELADRIIVLGVGGNYQAARAIFEALKSSYHNELPAETRLGIPRVYFEGNSNDNDALQDLLDLIQVSCIDPERREERWAVVAVSKTGDTIEMATALRVFRRDFVEYYGLRSEWFQQLFLAVTGTRSPLRDMFHAEGFSDEDILTIPDNVGSRYSVFTAACLLPAALMGLDVRAFVQGAAAMTKRFLEEPFERNPVLQFAAVNYLMNEEVGKPLRVLAVWSKKLEALGHWYANLVAESLGKHGRGPTPLTVVNPRDLHTRGQHHLEGPRDRLINNLFVKAPRSVPIGVQMADRNEDDLNVFARKNLVDLTAAAYRGTNEAYADLARPTADLILPTLTEHTLGQLFQMLMLTTVIEGRLMGVNPYSHPGVEAFKKNTRDKLRG